MHQTEAYIFGSTRQKRAEQRTFGLVVQFHFPSRGGLRAEQRSNFVSPEGHPPPPSRDQRGLNLVCVKPFQHNIKQWFDNRDKVEIRIAFIASLSVNYFFKLFFFLFLTSQLFYKFLFLLFLTFLDFLLLGIIKNCFS